VASIGITLGDVAGIGPEIVVKALSQLRGEFSNLTIIGSKSILTATMQILGERFSLPNVVDVGEVEFEYGIVQREAGRMALIALDKAIELLKEGKITSLVTAPVNKEAIQLINADFTGHTEYLARAFDVEDILMIAHSPYVSFAFATTHLALRDVPDIVNVELVLKKIELFDDYLSTLHQRNVKIAVLGLNPHCFEFSCGEDEKIAEAVEIANDKGMDISGPYPADTFHTHLEEVDGFLVQYHDQGMIPAKLMAQGKGVNVSWGLPFVRTSPLHGTAFDIAGQDKGNPESIIAAIRLAYLLQRS